MKAKKAEHLVSIGVERDQVKLHVECCIEERVDVQEAIFPASTAWAGLAKSFSYFSVSKGCPNTFPKQQTWLLMG